MSFMKGEVLTLVSRGSTVTVEWQQMFCQRKQDYVLCKYSTRGGANIPVFVQSGYSISQTLSVDSSLQFGMQSGVLFFVYHDKSQKIYQHRFQKNEIQQACYAANQLMKAYSGVDLSWIVGDYLRDVQ